MKKRKTISNLSKRFRMFKLSDKTKSFLSVVALYLALFFLIYFIHINFFYVNVIFYSSLVDSVLALLILLIANKIFFIFKSFSNFEKSQIFIILLLVGYSISISGPTVIDRSLSFYLLEKIRFYDGSISLDKMNDVISIDYLDEYSVLDARLTEQQQSGTIKIENGCVFLTDRGYKISNVSIFLRKNLLAQKRLIGDEYTDKLTNPLSKSIIKEEFKCNKDQ